MINRIKIASLRIMMWAALMILGSVTSFAESPTGTAATPPAQCGQSALQDGPSPAKSQPQQQPPDAGQGHFSSSQPRVFVSPDPNLQITVLENTLIRVRTSQPLSSRESKDGTPALFTLSEDVVVDNVLVIPRGATVHGEVIQTKKAGVLTGSPELTIELVSLDLGGQNYPLYTYQFKVQGTSKTKPTETKVKGGAVVGAIVGGIFSGSAKGETTAVGKLAGMGTGAALGAGVGAMTSAATPGPIVSAKEATRLSQGLHPGGPVLYVRGDIP
jgi:hypothetical protein